MRGKDQLRKIARERLDVAVANGLQMKGKLGVPKQSGKQANKKPFFLFLISTRNQNQLKNF